MARKPKTRRYEKLTSDRILTAALGIAGSQGWANVRMTHVAAYIDVSLVDLRGHYQDMNAIADGWFAHALVDMLVSPNKGFSNRPAKERLFIVITRWLDSLAVYHRVSAQMINQKLYLFHPQHWLPMVSSLSTLVHWILDAAMINSQGHQRKLEELGTTLLILATLRVWVEDDSESQTRTHTFLRQRLDQVEQVMRLLLPNRQPEDDKKPTAPNRPI